MGNVIFKEHVEEILSVADGTSSNRDADVVASWLRCLNDHKLDPELSGKARIVTEGRLKVHQQEVEEFLRMARYGLEDLYRRVDSMGYVLLLTDAKGVTVDFIGDDKVDRELKRAGLYLGSEWTEQEAGTCGVGACLATGEAIVVHQSDHFDVSHTPLSCTSVPIFDVLGDLLGVLDVSLLTSPVEKHSQGLVLETVKSCVRRIELANLMAKYRADWIVRMSPSPEFLEVDPSCAFAVASDGTIAGMTHGAQRLLADAASLDWRNPQNLIGKPFEDFFDFDVNDLSELTRGMGPDERTINTKKGKVAFANAMTPMPVSRRNFKSGQIPEPLLAIHGGDAALQQLCQKAAKIVDKQISVVLQGETGVGKEFVAKAMHHSRKKKGPFVAINCAALPEMLIESELFGYAPNAFTGASTKGKKGLIEQANGGTLFLDEIGDMPLALQARLLRVLAEREVMSVGGSKPVPVDFRVISASNRDLNELVNNGQFRQDLYYRLNGVVLEIPPVRERQDLEWLLGQISKKISADEAQMRITNEATQALKNYRWPGNVREIINVLELCAALCENSVLDTQHLPENIVNTIPVPDNTQPASRRGDLLDERVDLVALLSEVGWNVSKASRRLGVDRTTLHRRMKKLEIISPNHGG